MGAELDLVGAVQLGFAPLVFDGDDGSVFVKLDDIRLPAHGVDDRDERKSTGDPHASLRFIRAAVGGLVKDISFRRKLIFRPHLLEVNQGSTPFAIEQVIES